MANEEVLGPRKTMFVLVIVVGCFAVLWPRILSPLILGNTRDQLKPNQFDREAGCCEMIFESEVAVLELLNAVCSSIVHVDGKLSPYAAAECRKTVNETCGVDIAAFLKRDQNVGKATKSLLDMMKSSNSSCLKEHFGVPQWSVSSHTALNSWTYQDTVKQERPLHRAGTHPAMRERGRAIAPGAPAPATPAPTRASPVVMPPHVRVRSSPLDGYFNIDVKPPPIPGMRPPLGSPGGPVPAPKTSMGFVMPIYTICIIVFFVYTLSKLLFKRTGPTTYESISPDPQFRRRVFRDDSRATPDKLVVTAISGLVAEVQQQMEASYAQNQQRQDQQDNHARPYTNGTVLHSTGPVHIVASEYREQSKEKSPQPAKESTPEPKESVPEPKEPITEPEESTPEPEESSPEPKESTPESEESSPEAIDTTPDLEVELKTDAETNEQNESLPELKQTNTANINHKDANIDLIKLTEDVESVKDESLAQATKEFLENVKSDAESPEPKQSTPELLEEALKEESEDEDLEDEDEEDEEDEDKGTVKHVAEEVTSIFLEGDIPQQSRVLVAEFGGRAHDEPGAKHSPMVVSGKMTLSLIQDARGTPERDPESTVDEFTTASAATLPAEKDDDLSDEEIEEEIEVEEIEEEVDEEEEEEVEEEAEEDTKPPRKPAAAPATHEK